MEDLDLGTLPQAPETDTAAPNPEAENPLNIIPDADDIEGEELPGDTNAALEGDDADDTDEPKAPVELKDDTKVKLGDDEVTLAELKRGYMREVDYTQKRMVETNQLREIVVNSKREEVKAAQNFVHVTQAILQNFDNVFLPGYSQEAMAQLSYTDPAQYQALQARRDVGEQFKKIVFNAAQQASAQGSQAWEQANQIEQERVGAESAQMQQHLEMQGKRLASHKWYTEDFRRKGVSYAEKHGIPADLIRTTNYAGVVEILRKSMLYDDALTRSKTGKAPTQDIAVQPSARKQGMQQLNKRRDTELFDAARKGDRKASGAWLLANMPEA